MATISKTVADNKSEKKEIERKENPALRQEKDRLAREFVHLDKTHKTGMLSVQEYAAAKKSLERKQRTIEQKEKQETAKEKAVEEILGASSILSVKKSHTKKPLDNHSEKASDKVSHKISQKKSHEKYFVKFDTSDVSEKITTPENVTHPKEPEIAPLTQTGDLQPEGYKDLDELVREDSGHWRFAFALLTIFLLILLYVKFTSYGTVDDALAVDAYLDPTSSYSKDMYLALTVLTEEYDSVLHVDYYLTGASAQAALVNHAHFCAAKQDGGLAFLASYFAQEPFPSDAVGMIAVDLGLDSVAFETCLSDSSYAGLYADAQERAAELGITHTPTLLINNKKIVGAVGVDAVKIVIDQELVKLG